MERTVTLTRPKNVLMPGTPVSRCGYIGCQETATWYVNSRHQGSKIPACGMHLDQLADMAADGQFDA